MSCIKLQDVTKYEADGCLEVRSLESYTVYGLPMVKRRRDAKFGVDWFNGVDLYSEKTYIRGMCIKNEIAFLALRKSTKN